jgi:probable F420-dependent oxidoreductase
MSVNMTTDELRSRLGRIGIWMLPPAMTGVDPMAVAGMIERAGFTSAWIGGGNTTTEDFRTLRQLLSASSRLIVATGIVNVWAWEPGALRAEAQALAADFPGRFILGLGVSHAQRVTSLGHVYERPLEKMKKFLDELDQRAEGGAGGELPPMVLAALRQKMLEVSRDRTDGAHPAFTPPEHTAFARSVLGASPLLVPELGVSLAASLVEGMAAGRAYADFYLKLPNYTSYLRPFGFTDEDLAGRGSDRLISAIIPTGASRVLDRVREHLDAGADHVVVQPINASGGLAFDQLEKLAVTLTELMK